MAPTHLRSRAGQVNEDNRPGDEQAEGQQIELPPLAQVSSHTDGLLQTIHSNVNMLSTDVQTSIGLLINKMDQNAETSKTYIEAMMMANDQTQKAINNLVQEIGNLNMSVNSTNRHIGSLSKGKTKESAILAEEPVFDSSGSHSGQGISIGRKSPRAAGMPDFGLGGQMFNNHHTPEHRNFPINQNRNEGALNLDRNQVLDMVNQAIGQIPNRRVIRPTYRQPYPEWIDRENEFPKGFKIPDFTLFSGEYGQSTIEHIGRFTLQCKEAASNQYLKLRLFGGSLTGQAFTWYISLPHESVNTWYAMEEKFHTQFYRTEPEVSMVDLARFKQQAGESAEMFIGRFKTARNKCKVVLPESEFVKLAQNGLDFELRKKFEGMEFLDLYELSARVTRYEWLLNEEGQRRNSSIGTYFQDPNYEVNLAEVVAKKPMVCPSLLKKSVESIGSYNKKGDTTSKQYSFDITMVDEIFDHLLAAGFIKLSESHVMPSNDEIKKGEYCKYHGKKVNQKSHSTQNCIAFRNLVQEQIEKGLLKYPEEMKKEMTVDTTPFPKVACNMMTAKMLTTTATEESSTETKLQPKGHVLCERCFQDVKRPANPYQPYQPQALFQPAHTHYYNPAWLNNTVQVTNPHMPYPTFYPQPQMQPNPIIHQLPPAQPVTFAQKTNPVHIPGVSPPPKTQPKTPVKFQPKTEQKIRQGINRVAETPRQRQTQHQPRFVPRESPRQFYQNGDKIYRPGVGMSPVWKRTPKPFKDMTRTQKRRFLRQKQELAKVEVRFENKGMIVEEKEEITPRRKLDFGQRSKAEKGDVEEQKKEVSDIMLVDDEGDDLLIEELMAAGFDEPEVESKIEELKAEIEEKKPEDVIQFGSIQPTSMSCNMITVLPRIFKAKPGQPTSMVGDVEDGQKPMVEKLQMSDQVMVFNKPTQTVKHMKALYLTVHMNGIPVSRVMVDGGSALNILPTSTMKKIGRTEDDLIPTDISVTSFVGAASRSRGILPVELQIGGKIDTVPFFVVDANVDYNALLGRNWIHANECVPSTLHQLVIFWNGERLEIVKGDPQPWTMQANLTETDLEWSGPLKCVGLDKNGNPADVIDTATNRSVVSKKKVHGESTKKKFHEEDTTLLWSETSGHAEGV